MFDESDTIAISGFWDQNIDARAATTVVIFLKGKPQSSTHVGVSKNQGALMQSQNSRALMIRTPKKWTPN